MAVLKSRARFGDGSRRCGDVRAEAMRALPPRPRWQPEILQIKSDQFRLPPWTVSEVGFMIAFDLQNKFDLWNKVSAGQTRRDTMANEKRNDQEIIVDKNELSEQDLEQASGGVSIAAANREKLVHDNTHKNK